MRQQKAEKCEQAEEPLLQKDENAGADVAASESTVAARAQVPERIRRHLPGLVRTTLLSLVVLYDELVLHLFTLGEYTLMSFFMTGVFSFAFGLFLHSLRALVSDKKIRRRVTMFMLFFTALVFMIFFFIYMQFKIFYDLNTVFFAGGDAAEGFTGEIIRMVTSAEGIVGIVLFLLPFVLYTVGTRRLMQKEKNLYPAYSPKKKILYAVVTVAVFICGILIIRLTPVLNTIYTTNYSFTNVVAQTGLLTGLRRDAVRMITGEDRQVTFSVEDELSGEDIDEEYVSTGTESTDTDLGDAPAGTGGTGNDPAGSDLEGEEATAPVVRGDNVLDIDFAGLAAESTGTFAAVDSYVSTRKPTAKNEYTGLFKGKNLIFITMESFSGFPIDEELFPTLYKLQQEGFRFQNYYVPYVAATTGSEYSLLKGLLPVAGAASMTSTASFHNYMTLGSFFTREGYFGQMYHNGDVWYYDRHITHNKLGYSEEYMAYGGGLDILMEQPMPRRDTEMARVTLPLYVQNEPFNIYYITMSGHSPYDIYQNPFAVTGDDNRTTEADSSTDVTEGQTDGANESDTAEEASAADDMEAYAGAQQQALKERNYTPIIETYLIYQMEADKMAKTLLEGLEAAGVLEDTVIVMTGDHYPYGVYDGSGYRNLLGELYGYEIVNDFDRDRNNLIIWTPSLAEKEPVTIREPVAAIDVLPTLLNLFGFPYDSRLLPGRDVFSGTAALVFNSNHDWRTSKGTYIAATATFTPAAGVDKASLSGRYVEVMCETVKNKIEYCRSLTYNDYYYHVFGEEYPGSRQEEKPAVKQKE